MRSSSPDRASRQGDFHTAAVDANQLPQDTGSAAGTGTSFPGARDLERVRMQIEDALRGAERGSDAVENGLLDRPKDMMGMGTMGAAQNEPVTLPGTVPVPPSPSRPGAVELSNPGEQVLTECPLNFLSCFVCKNIQCHDSTSR